ncbi:MAG TPA: hypothetical protein PLD10_17610, partial [Rhodopila sp.]|nr:hypothetical protein [Rhodopila sp.]
WFDELARILKPGGAAAITTHGPGSLLFYAQQGIKPVQRYREIFAAMLANGYAFEEVWMQADDVGNVATEAEWGNSFLAPDVVYSLTADRFDIALYRPRANQNNQDLYVLRRR